MITVRTASSAMMALSLCASARVAAAQPQHHRHNTPQVLIAPPPVATPAAPVSPPPVDEVEAEHLRGVELRRQHRDGEARDLFRALFERSHESRALAWQAGAEAALGEWVSAEEHLASALENTADPWITQLRTDLESDLATFRQHVGLLEVISDTPHAEVWLAGARASSLPMEHPLTVRAGTVTIEVRADGFLPEVRSVEVPAGMRAPARETVNLTPRAAAPPPVIAAVTAPPLAQRNDNNDPGPVHPLRIVGAVGLGLGAVGLGIGIYGVVHASSLRSNYVDSACDTLAPPADCTGADDGSGWLTGGVAGLVTGGVLVAGGLTLLFIPLRSSRRASANAITVAPGPGTFGFSLRGTF